MICAISLPSFAVSDFDGRWTGTLRATDSLMGCAGSAFPVTLNVRDGVISGAVRLPTGGPHTLRGAVTAAGQITAKAGRERVHARSATDGMTSLRLQLTGKLTGRRGEGVWSSNILGDCDGVFELHRR